MRRSLVLNASYEPLGVVSWRRAVCLLIDELGMAESDAFSFIQRTAMSERTKMRDVADRILDGSLRPDPT